MCNDKLKEYVAEHMGEVSFLKPKEGVYLKMVAELQKEYAMQSLQRSKGNKVRAAQIAGVNRNTFRKWCVENNINAEDFRDEAYQ